jgi:hypothetical protein
LRLSASMTRGQWVSATAVLGGSLQPGRHRAPDRVSAVSADQAVAVGYVDKTLEGITLGWDGTSWSQCDRRCP